MTPSELFFEGTIPPNDPLRLLRSLRVNKSINLLRTFQFTRLLYLIWMENPREILRKSGRLMLSGAIVLLVLS